MKPLLFQAFIGGYCGSSFEVKLLEDGRLAYSVSEGGKEASSEILSINDSSWAELRIVLEHARVRDWEGNYDAHIMDGTQWDLHIVYADWQKRCHGSNEYPPSGQFDTFLQAIRDLAGGRAFE
jgi:hypothetical protein